MYKTRQTTKNIGDRLREKRDLMGLSVDDVSVELRIRKKFIIALEQNDYDVFPSETYAKGFIRNYSKLLNLDEKTMLRIFRRDVESTQKSSIDEIKDDSIQSGVNLKLGINRGILIVLGVSFFIFLFLFVYRLVIINQKPSLYIHSPFITSVQDSSEYSFDTNEDSLIIEGNISAGNSLYLNDEQVETFGLGDIKIFIENINNGENFYYIKTKNQFGVESVLRLKIIKK